MKEQSQVARFLFPGLLLAIPVVFVLFFGVNEGIRWSALQVSNPAQFPATSGEPQLGVVGDALGGDPVQVLFYPALTTDLPAAARITRILPVSAGIYLLDGASGEVIYAAENGAGKYQVDPGFHCGQSRIGENKIGPLVDIAALDDLTSQQLNAQVIGIDSSGAVIYCNPQDGATGGGPLLLPDPGWMRITHIAVLGDILAVLDRDNNQIYTYSLNNILISHPDKLGLGQFQPDSVDMRRTVDLAFLNDHLFLLSAEGQVTDCLLSDYYSASTRCDYETAFSFPPVSEKNKTVSLDLRFTSLTKSDRPPLLYMLNPFSHQVYQFSAQRSFVKLFDFSRIAPGETADGLGIALDQSLYIAVGKQIYQIKQ